MKPVFHEDAESIKRVLRLGNLPGGGQSKEILEESIREARSTLWQHLGSERIAELQAIVPTSPPADDDAYLIELAQITESSLVRFHLAARMPVGWRDGNLDFLASYQTEGNHSRLSMEQTEKLRDLWWNGEGGILEKLEILLHGPPTRSESAGRVASRGVPSDDYVDTRELWYGRSEIKITDLRSF